MLEKIYNTSGKQEDIASLSDVEVLDLAENLKDGVPFATPVFDGATEQEIKNMLELAGLPKSGQVTLLMAEPEKPSTDPYPWGICMC